MRATPCPALFPLSLLGLALLASAARVRADWRDEVGATRLNTTFSNVPTAAGIVTQVEAGETAQNNYLPDTASPAFAGKTFVNRSTGGTAASGHATAVGRYFYGTSDSLLPATSTIHVYNANGWLGSDFLGWGGTSAPLTEAGRVQNHSWVATANFTEADIANIDQRLDFAINRDGFIAVAGANNGTSSTLPLLLAQAYNHLTVGRTDGMHSAGFTTSDGAGRIKPDLVAPDSFTSTTTPMVASAAGVLGARAVQSPHSLAGADLPRVVKALLLAGATKEEFPAWARTTARPLDLRHGAGELNVLLAYRALEAGRATASASVLGPETGWSATTLGGGTQRTHFFEIAAGAASAPFSVALTWHRVVNSGGIGPFWSPSPQPLVNLDLKLHAATGFTLGAVLDQSVSAVDNIEHIYAPSLPPGRYALVVASPSGAATTAYALAWRATPTVGVVSTTPVARELDGAAGVFTITRTGFTGTPLLVPLGIGGTAQPGTHYTALPTSVLIPAGSASTTVTVALIGDAVAQGDRDVVLTVAGDYSVAAGVQASATVTIQDKPYDGWRFAHFDAGQLANATVSGDSADPDADGWVNLLEYALGGEPLTSDAAASAPLVASESDENSSWLTLAYTEPEGREDLVYIVEWSDDLTAPWQSGATVVSEFSRTPVAGGERVIVRATTTLAAAPGQFLRLRVTRP